MTESVSDEYDVSGRWRRWEDSWSGSERYQRMR